MYKRGVQGWLKHIDFIICDVLGLMASFFIAYLLRFGMETEHFFGHYDGLLLVMLVMDLGVSILFNTMHNVLKRDSYREFNETLRHTMLVYIATLIALVSLKASAYFSRLIMYGTFVIHLPAGYAMRLIYKRFLLEHVIRVKQRSMLVVADEAQAEQIIRNLERKANKFFTVTGVVIAGRDAEGESVAGVKVVANLAGAAEYVCREWIDEVFLSVEKLEAAQLLIDQCREMGVVIHTRLPFEYSEDRQQSVERIGGYSVLTNSVNTVTPFQVIVKRAMDIAGGLVGCVLAVLVIAIVGPMIKKASPGPILYVQERVGLNGKRFKFYKIRSMYMDADERKKELMSQNRVADGRMFKLDFDPRIIGNEILPDGTTRTGIGAFIRKTSLDEFPQFINVLKGEMSLVGTRPPTVDEWERYELRHRARLAMKPGITGMWQVSGRSDITDFEEIVKLDMQYICSWSITLDIRILLKTVFAVLNKSGAM